MTVVRRSEESGQRERRYKWRGPIGRDGFPPLRPFGEISSPWRPLRLAEQGSAPAERRSALPQPSANGEPPTVIDRRYRSEGAEHRSALRMGLRPRRA